MRATPFLSFLAQMTSMTADVKQVIPLNKGPRCPSVTLIHSSCSLNHACNQLGTPGRVKSFLKGAQIFSTVSNSFETISNT